LPYTYALATDELGHLFIGGSLYFAGPVVSPHIAQANLMPQRGVIQNIGTAGGSIVIDCLGLPGMAYSVERATDVDCTANLVPLLSTNAPAPDGSFRYTDPNPPGPTGFYRLHQQ
jgi:hypothetical protein